jgi:hypothetical protein
VRALKPTNKEKIEAKEPRIGISGAGCDRVNRSPPPGLRVNAVHSVQTGSALLRLIPINVPLAAFADLIRRKKRFFRSQHQTRK